ncbi:uncharacterized protein OCT59_024080 [Rhizophagus irregularis]|uniref:uncharacterized protein n=1 Tax=Rhizophagus irregularis TaxID=588596 RepID=UPI003324CC2D|nr:hypothetical protein OCT59_024080 [Rhizophagus irregularis]
MMEATDPSEEIKKILLKSKVMLLKSKLALVNKFNAWNDTLLKHIKKAEQILQNVFYKKDNEINLEILPQLHKVKTILNEYDEPLEKATEDNFVDLDSILFVPNYQGNYKFQQHWLMKWVGNIFQVSTIHQ